MENINIEYKRVGISKDLISHSKFLKDYKISNRIENEEDDCREKNKSGKIIVSIQGYHSVSKYKSEETRFKLATKESNRLSSYILNRSKSYLFSIIINNKNFGHILVDGANGKLSSQNLQNKIIILYMSHNQYLLININNNDKVLLSLIGKNPTFYISNIQDNEVVYSTYDKNTKLTCFYSTVENKILFKVNNLKNCENMLYKIEFDKESVLMNNHNTIQQFFKYNTQFIIILTNAYVSLYQFDRNDEAYHFVNSVNISFMQCKFNILSCYSSIINIQSSSDYCYTITLIESSNDGAFPYIFTLNLNKEKFLIIIDQLKFILYFNLTLNNKELTEIHDKLILFFESHQLASFVENLINIINKDNLNYMLQMILNDYKLPVILIFLFITNNYTTFSKLYIKFANYNKFLLEMLILSNIEVLRSIEYSMKSIEKLLKDFLSLASIEVNLDHYIN